MKTRWTAGLLVAFSTAVLGSMSIGLSSGTAQDLAPAATEQAQTPAEGAAKSAKPAGGTAAAAKPAAPEAPKEEEKEEKTGCCG